MDNAIALLFSYGFDLSGYTNDDLVRVFSKYAPQWVQSAIVECIFRGRYKAISVLQLLTAWEKRGQSKCHFTKEFERLICQNINIQEPTLTTPEGKTPSQTEVYRNAIGAVSLTAHNSPFLQKLRDMCTNPDD